MKLTVENQTGVSGNITKICVFPFLRRRARTTTISQLEINESSAHSTYDALTLSLRRRFAQRFQFEANYTFARNRDDDSNERNFSRQTTLNPFNLQAEEGPSKQDVRHNLNLSGLVDLGYGFTLSGIIITRSGFPYTAVIEDGTDTNGDLNDNKKPKQNRAAVLSIEGCAAPKYTPLRWLGDETPIDLEAVTSVPGAANNFMALTAAGRVFHLLLDRENNSVKVIKSFDVPQIPKKSESEGR
jgi:hypothetical protein